MFLLDPNHPWPPGRVDPNALTPKSRIGKFRKAVSLEHGITLFTTPDSLATKVHEALRAHEQRDRPPDVASIAAVRERYLDWLKRECESIELLGLDLKESQNVRLGQVYVPAVIGARDDIEIGKMGMLLRLRRALYPQTVELLLHRIGIESLYGCARCR